MIKIAEITNVIMEGVYPTLEQRGFFLNKKEREFKRSIPDCVQIFDMLFYKKSTHISVKPEVRIKILSIEKIYSEATEIDGRPHRTLGNHLYEILRYIDDGEEVDSGDRAVADWLIENQEDVDKLIEVIPKYLEKTILPYFNENSSVSRVDNLLNKYPRELSIHNSLYPLRANIAIIAAKLNKNPRYDELLQIYEEELLDAANSYKEEFYKLKEILKGY